MDYIILTLNTILPVIVLIIIGYLLRKKNIINDSFVTMSSKIVFNLALPATLFYGTAKTDMSSNITKETWSFILLACVILISMYLISELISKFTITDLQTRGAFVQGSFRCNYVIIGYPILIGLFGDNIIFYMALLAIFLVPINNIASTITLTINNPNTPNLSAKKIILNIIKNPLVIGILGGFIFSYFKINIPVFIGNSLEFVKGLTTPLALMNIGSLFNFNMNFKNNFPLLGAILLKIIIYPIIFISITIALGFRNEYLGVIFIALSAPAAASSFIMAKAMESNEKLAADIVVISTSLSAITIFVGAVILKSMNLF